MKNSFLKHEFEPHVDDAAGLSAIDDDRMRFRLAPNGRVYGVSTSRQFRDDQAATLLKLPRLVDFTTGYHRVLDNPPFTDDGISTLRKHECLQAFGLAYNPNITDESLRTLATMPRVKWLKVPHCRITDEGVSHLAHCSQLLHLHLAGNSVTDDSLGTLANLTRLTLLAVSDTQITLDGIKMLSSKLPRCRLV